MIHILIMNGYDILTTKHISGLCVMGCSLLQVELLCKSSELTRFTEAGGFTFIGTLHLGFDHGLWEPLQLAHGMTLP
jgi:hypothetical protein